MEAVVPFGWFIGRRLPGFGRRSIGHARSIALMIGFLKRGVALCLHMSRYVYKCRAKSTYVAGFKIYWMLFLVSFGVGWPVVGR